jgi:hypothetical protein
MTGSNDTPGKEAGQKIDIVRKGDSGELKGQNSTHPQNLLKVYASPREPKSGGHSDGFCMPSPAEIIQRTLSARVMVRAGPAHPLNTRTILVTSSLIEIRSSLKNKF